MTSRVPAVLGPLAALLLAAPRGTPAQAADETSPPAAAPAEPPADRAPDLRASPAAALAPSGAAVDDLDFVLGGRLTEIDGSRVKLEEFGRVGDDVVIGRLRLRASGPTPADFVEVDVVDATEDDESYRLSLGRRGRFRLDLAYQAMPHLYANGAYLWGGLGAGRLQIADIVQQELEANEQTAAERGPPATDPVTDTAGEDAIQQGIVRGLYDASNRFDVRAQRQRFGASLEADVARDAAVRFRVVNENRSGTRPLVTGAYERWAEGSGLAHVADRFLVLGAELPEPVDYRTLRAEAGAGVHRDGWAADLAYAFSRFRNLEDVLLWDNPFRATDAAQVGGFDRSRFVVGQLVLPPDSNSHELTATGATDLPLHGRLTATASFGLVTQDDAFQPYTRNTAIIATDLAGAPVGPAPTAPLPAPDLGGEVRTLAGTVLASVRPAEALSLDAKYRAYRYDGRSDVITFPGYAAFGESGWRREKNDVSAELDAPVRNEVFDYWRHDADLGADLRVTRTLTISAEVVAEWWRFTDLRVDKLDEYGAGAGFAVRPSRALTLEAHYRFADRTAEGYLRGATAENPEARGLLNYNWSDRTRHVAVARVQLRPSRAVTLGLLGRFADEEYGGKTEGDTPIDQLRFGRTGLQRWIGSADVGVTPAERLALQATYTIERRTEDMSLAAKDDGPKAADDFGFNDNFAPENYWDSEVLETVHSLDLSASVDLVPDRVTLWAGYSLSFSDVEVDTTNPNGVTATTLANAVAVGWPTIQNRLHSITGDLAIALTPSVRAGVRYLYESYDLDDFAFDVMEPYMAGRSVENSTRFAFADATYGAYDANVGTVYVAGSF